MVGSIWEERERERERERDCKGFSSGKKKSIFPVLDLEEKK